MFSDIFHCQLIVCRWISPKLVACSWLVVQRRRIYIYGFCWNTFLYRSQGVTRAYPCSRWKNRAHTKRPIERWPCTKVWQWPSTPSTSMRSTSLARISLNWLTFVTLRFYRFTYLQQQYFAGLAVTISKHSFRCESCSLVPIYIIHHQCRWWW